MNVPRGACLVQQCADVYEDQAVIGSPACFTTTRYDQGCLSLDWVSCMSPALAPVIEIFAGGIVGACTSRDTWWYEGTLLRVPAAEMHKGSGIL
jgi:hypothetical protein